MRLVVLPAIRLSRVRERLDGLALPPRMCKAIMQIIEDEIEVGARRIGSVCPIEGCRRILDDKRHEVRDGNSVFMWQECPDHGHIDDHGGLPLAIAFDPCSSNPKGNDGALEE
jgi:hypothetical protein